jgi:hypothetical protein
MKQALITAVALFFPDYALPWILRVDAVNVALDTVLCQVCTGEDGSER